MPVTPVRMAHISSSALDPQNIQTPHEYSKSFNDPSTSEKISAGAEKRQECSLIVESARLVATQPGSMRNPYGGFLVAENFYTGSMTGYSTLLGCGYTGILAGGFHDQFNICILYT